jgi:SIR2-like domain
LTVTFVRFTFLVITFPIRDTVRDTVQDCNLNFLVGSGLSCPYLTTLGPIESYLSKLENTALPEAQKTIIKCALYKSYFDGVMSKHCDILNNDTAAEPYVASYYNFFKILNSVLQCRKSTILGKEVNLFTTNIDIFMEKAIERLGIECNDGFCGRFEPWFSIANFKKAHFRRSFQYDNVSELPTVNLLKLHGSLTWEFKGDESLTFCQTLSHVRQLQAQVISPGVLLSVTPGASFDDLVAGSTGMVPDKSVEDFLAAYSNLPIVNPTKGKFQHTLMNQTHYEMLRIYSNELEKENTVLFTLGFSFADEHILEITLRAAASNPTLMVYVVAYDSNAEKDIQARFPAIEIPNNNISVIAPARDPICLSSPLEPVFLRVCLQMFQ